MAGRLPGNRAPRTGFAANAAWAELALAATDLLTWVRALCFTGAIARAERATFRYQILHVGAQLVRTARTCRLKIDTDWPWAASLAQAYHRLHAAFP